MHNYNVGVGLVKAAHFLSFDYFRKLDSESVITDENELQLI